MISQYFLPIFICLLLFNVHVCYSQVPTPTRGTLIGKFTAPHDFWTEAPVPISTYVDAHTTFTISGIPVTTTITATDSAATAIYTAYEGLPIEAVSLDMAYIFDLSMISGDPVCTYPISGTWSRYPRIVFWATIIFALMARTHEWLIGGALAAALSFSSLAALQVSFQVWTGQAWGELDFFPIVGILVGSCVVVVPLMNWSTTIRQLGLEKNAPSTSDRAADQIHTSNSAKKEYGSTRTVLVFWSLLVAIGFLSAFVGYQSFVRNTGNTTGAVWTPFVTINNGSVFCQPPNGYLDTTAGQLFGWQNFWVTTEFLQQNNCIDPCPFAEFTTLFRSSAELQSLDMQSIDRWGEQKHSTAKEEEYLNFIFDYYNHLLFLLPVIILQGTLQIIFFWRTSPQRARREIYVWWSKISTPGQFETQRRTLHSRVGVFLALTFYLVAVAIIPIAIIGFIMNIVVTEVFLTWIPQGETGNHVDQWGVFAVTLLVLIAALICRFDAGTRIIWQKAKLEAKKDFIQHQIDRRLQHDRQSCKSLGCVRQVRSDATSILSQMKNIVVTVIIASKDELVDLVAGLKYRITDFLLLLQYEGHLLKQFWDVPYVKPQRRDKNQDKDKNGNPVYCAKKPESIRIKKRDEREEQIAKLREAVKTAKDELKLKCGTNNALLQIKTSKDVESQQLDNFDQVPLLPLLPDALSRKRSGQESSPPRQYSSPQAHGNIGGNNSTHRISPQRHNPIPRRQVPKRHTPLPSPGNSAEMQKIAPIHRPSSPSSNHADARPQSFMVPIGHPSGNSVIQNVLSPHDPAHQHPHQSPTSNSSTQDHEDR